MINIKDIGRIGILAGGPSSEREISLKSGKAVFEALKNKGCDVIFLDIEKDVYKSVKESKISVAFIALHGRFGEDGTVQRILEDMNMPFTGSEVFASRAALDKILSKEIFKKNAIPIAEYAVFEKNKINNLNSLKFPLVVKPQNEGSSIGLSIVEKEGDLEGALTRAYAYDDLVLVEEFIKGKELTVGILGDEALPVIQIVPGGSACYDFQAKYNNPETKYIVPAPIAKAKYKKAQKLALAAHNSLGCKAFSRVDIMLDNDGGLYVLEVNTIPGLTSRSLLPKAAAAAGISFEELCIKLIELSLSK